MDAGEASVKGLPVLQATELLIGLWLRGLPQPDCERTISEWREKLTATCGNANDNDPHGLSPAKERAVALLDAACETCPLVCPRNAAISLRAPPGLAARQASLPGMHL